MYVPWEFRHDFGMKKLKRWDVISRCETRDCDDRYSVVAYTMIRHFH